MSYRPITDLWILARPKVRYYGAYPNGFLQRARVLLGVSREDALLHVCGGCARQYPNGAFGPNDRTLDLDPMLSPDYLQDALQPLPDAPWRAILIDPPYTVDDAAHYAPGTFPSANALLKNALMAVEPGGRVGMLHYVWPQPPKSISCKSVAAVGVIVGFNNRIRIFSVFERGAS